MVPVKLFIKWPHPRSFPQADGPSSFRLSAAQSEIFFSAIFNRDESHKIKAIKNRNKFVSNCKFETTVMLAII